MAGYTSAIFSIFIIVYLFSFSFLVLDGFWWGVVFYLDEFGCLGLGVRFYFPFSFEKGIIFLICFLFVRLGVIGLLVALG